jgi:hypothetical protein
MQAQAPLEMTWFDPQVKQLPFESRSSSLWHWLMHCMPLRVLPAGHLQELIPSKTCPPGQTEQRPLIMKPLGRLLQRVQTWAELKA